MTHIYFSKLTIIDSDKGLSPGRHQAIVWTNDGISIIGPLETNFSEILIRIQTISFKKMCLKMSSAKWRPFGLCLNELRVSMVRLGRDDWLFIEDISYNCIFFGKKYLHFGSDFTVVWSLGYDWLEVSIGSGNSLVLNRQQVITWTNVNPIHWCIFASLGLNSLRPRLNRCPFANDIFKCIFLNVN